MYKQAHLWLIKNLTQAYPAHDLALTLIWHLLDHYPLLDWIFIKFALIKP